MLHPIHRWLTDLEHTACGLRRPHVVRGVAGRHLSAVSGLHPRETRAVAAAAAREPRAPQGTPARAAVTRSRGSQHS